LVLINGYYISDYCGYSIGEYECLLMVIILVAIDGYSIGGFWYLLMAIILVVILLMDISAY
jgi:hypothetical protein